jgi:lipopolysaccharide transport system ATP-binding protein
MTDFAIRASEVGKRYRMRETDLAFHFETLREAMGSWLSRRRDNRRIEAESFWALKDVTFDVRAGEALGIIGHNGAGKSTLLKILSRITEPTEGAVEVRGRVGSLLDVGAGFHPELTGRENVYLNGAILGMKRAEIVRKFEEIVSFAGTEAFLDTPVKHYSTGMYMRLAFAIAAYLEQEVIVVDEILAMGDAAFQKKCLGKMGDVAKSGRTVLFVSHNLGAIRSLCTRALVLSRGTMSYDGTPNAAIEHYLARSAAADKGEGQILFGRDGLVFDNIRLRAVRLLDEAGQMRALFDATESIRVEIEYEIATPLHGARTLLFISTEEGELAFKSTDHLLRNAHQEPGVYKTSCTIPGALLNCRLYQVELSFDIPGSRTLAPRRSYVSFTVAGGGNQGSIFPEPWPGVVCPSLRWSTKRQD